ncbi:MAG: protein encoded in hypervariable junctions of pilus protein cluster [Chloroflexi bacterium]|nr:MAG: protein encoded in hypervariable junctions of pilus protein cluster [Chloroflexota bacterium]
MKYLDYEAVVEYDENARVFHGEVLHIRDVITFQGATVDELEQSFHESVDDYMAFCAERGESPEKPYSGKLILRIPPDLHRKVSARAKAEKVSVNHLISEALEAYTTKR